MVVWFVATLSQRTTKRLRRITKRMRPFLNAFGSLQWHSIPGTALRYGVNPVPLFAVNGAVIHKKHTCWMNLVVAIDD
jgi:hypothetical protein